MTVYGMTLPAATVAALQRALDELRTQTPYVYPWAGLEGGIRLVGYGSLLNAASAARTLAPAGPRRAVLAFGARRLFDSEMSAAALQRYGAGPDSRGGAALNVRVTGAIGDAVNGILFDIPAEEIEPLRQREIGYDLAPVICFPWERLVGQTFLSAEERQTGMSAPPSPFVAHILTRPAHPAAEASRNGPLLPHRAYYLLCREGAASVSDSFLRFFLASTFLADGLTPVAEWEREA
ncbi:MAG TPA: hypothetical protein VKD72_03875 [Gemmataceae bacterium]|nr:hypothetical protein [Gemmataceae bacterium]